MKFAQAILAFATISGVLATSSKNKKDHDVQTANFKFRGDHSGSYKLSVKADGKEVETDNDLVVKTIDSNDYKADSLCTFKTPDGKTVKPVMHPNATDGTQELVFEHPTAIGSVSCEGMCVGKYGKCYDKDNQYIGPCCNGFCAATLCRPWDSTHE